MLVRVRGRREGLGESDRHFLVFADLDAFHVVRLAGDELDQCRRRVQQAIRGHRGRKGDLLYTARRILHTGADLLTDQHKDRLAELFATDEHVEVEATWGSTSA